MENIEMLLLIGGIGSATINRIIQYFRDKNIIGKGEAQPYVLILALIGSIVITSFSKELTFLSGIILFGLFSGISVLIHDLVEYGKEHPVRKPLP